MVKTRPAPGVIAQRRNSDLLGLAFFFLGAVLLLWLTWPQPEQVPHFLRDSLQLLAGSGAFAVPVILMFVGAMFLVGYSRLTFSHSSFGSILLFLAYVTWRHLMVPIPNQPIHLPSASDLSVESTLPGPEWTDSHLMRAGGYVGAILGTVLQKTLGLPGTYLLLAFMTCAAVVLLIERPFIELLNT